MRHGHLRQSSQGGAASGAPQDAVALRRVEVTRTFLALDEPAQFRPYSKMSPLGGVQLLQRAPCLPELYRRLYREVGAQWQWRDRLTWSDAQLVAHLADPRVGVWEMNAAGESMGFFELMRDEDGGVEIAYFGLLPRFIGLRLGGWMLTFAVQRAWDWGATRVWLHTCTLDSPHALPNYVARGFRPFKTERFTQEID